ncbi:FKBP-type peptidyl-prolyl cis-trans isomerase [Shewanella mangrovisoli]|uniref:FKBP-type peptidyl-prolyl cis-trans isomerase n=1 Tax=Shewanella mangrovisoli TaxID=2864211 RepID=UPI00370CBEF1
MSRYIEPDIRASTRSDVGYGCVYTLGQGRMIEGFEDGLIGKMANEVTTLNLRFPDGYHTENL